MKMLRLFFGLLAVAFAMSTVPSAHAAFLGISKKKWQRIGSGALGATVGAGAGFVTAGPAGVLPGGVAGGVGGYQAGKPKKPNR